MRIQNSFLIMLILVYIKDNFKFDDAFKIVQFSNCPVCQKPFVHKTVMKRHIENIHEKKKQHAAFSSHKKWSNKKH